MPVARCRFLLTLAALALLAAPAAADTIIKKSGPPLTGLIVAESENDVTLETHIEALVVRTKIARKDIAEIRKDPRAQNRYCRIPIHGEIGADVKAEWLAKALQDAAALHANYLVLDIDSPGGQAGEMIKILDILKAQKQFTTVAHIHRAMSAAAIIALACKSIVVDPQATIGAAVPWKFGPDGTPSDVEAKFFSSFRATAKAAADAGNHSPLLARGMMEMNLVLSVAGSGPAAQVVEGHPKDTTPLKKSGEILCLSSSEALQCGLAAGSAEKPADLQKALALPDWAAVGESVWSFMESRPALEKANTERHAAVSVANSDHDKMQILLTTVNSKIVAANQAKEDAAKRAAALPLEYRGELNKIDPALTPAQHDAKVLEIRTRYETQYAEAENTLSKSDAELQDLIKLRDTIQTKLRN